MKLQIPSWLEVNVVMLLYDTTSLGSFDRALDAFKLISPRIAPSCELLFVGTKCDIKVRWSRAEVEITVDRA